MASSKKSGPKPSAKFGQNYGGSQKSFFGGAQGARESAEKVVNFSSGAVKDMLAGSAGEAQKAQERLFSMGRESVEQMAKSTDAATKAMMEAISASRDSVETCLECGNATAALAKQLSSEWFESTNRALSESVEMSKAALSCRTMSDMVELNNRAVRQACDQFFSQSTRLSDMLFDYSSEALEPLSARASETARRFSKAVAA